MTKKILHLDMDGVVADFDKAIQTIAPGTDMASFSKEVDDICTSNPDIFNILEPIAGAIESVKELAGYYDIYFLSTPMWHVPQSYTDKRLWLERHFGKLAEKKLILTHRKDLVFGHYLVDDRLAHGSEEFKGIHIHFGTAPFNNWGIVRTHLIHLAIYQPEKTTA